MVNKRLFGRHNIMYVDTLFSSHIHLLLWCNQSRRHTQTQRERERERDPPSDGTKGLVEGAKSPNSFLLSPFALAYMGIFLCWYYIHLQKWQAVVVVVIVIVVIFQLASYFLISLSLYWAHSANSVPFYIPNFGYNNVQQCCSFPFQKVYVYVV